MIPRDGIRNEQRYDKVMVIHTELGLSHKRAIHCETICVMINATEIPECLGNDIGCLMSNINPTDLTNNLGNDIRVNSNDDEPVLVTGNIDKIIRILQEFIRITLRFI